MGNALMERLGMRVPVIQAPMAGGTTTPELVAAVAQAGGLGFVGSAYQAPEAIVRTARSIRALTDRPFGINLFSPQPEPSLPADPSPALGALVPYHAELGLPPPALPNDVRDPYAAQVPAVLASGAAAFSFTFGIPPAADLAAAKDAGMLVLGTATTVDEAVALEAAGVDAVVAQGAEAGAHRGTFGGDFAAAMIGTMALVPQVVDAVTVPVVASGGIMDGRGIVAALALGASAVQMGTAFLVCDESGTPACHKDAVLAAKPHETRITRAFSGRPARGIVNRVMREVGDPAHPERIQPYPVQNALTRGMRAEAGRQGHSDYLSLWSGQGGPLGRREPAAATVARLAGEIREALQVVHQGFTM